MAMNKHQNNARGNKPYADQPTSGGTGDTRNKLSKGGAVGGFQKGVPGHDSLGHKQGPKLGCKT